MKAWEPSRDSLHYHLAKTYGQMYYYEGRRQTYNSCEYVSYVLKGLLIILFALIVGGIVIGFPFGDLLAWAAASIKFHEFLHVSEVGQIGVLISIAAFVVALAIGIGIGCFELSYIIRKNRAPRPVKEPSFLSVAYHTLHDKYCVPVKFK